MRHANPTVPLQEAGRNGAHANGHEESSSPTPYERQFRQPAREPEEPKEEKDHWERFLDTLRRHSALKVALVTLAAAFVGGLIVYLTHERAKTEAAFYIFQEIGKGVIVTGLISGAVKWYVTSQTKELDQAVKNLNQQKEQTFREESKRALSELREGVTRQTDRLMESAYSLAELREEVRLQTARMVASASSLVALQDAGVVKAFRNREEAADDVRATLVSEDLTSIKLIGISLNDFVRDENSTLHSAMRALERRITEGGARDGGAPGAEPGMLIQVLLIDPESNGAFLRATAEDEGVLAKSRLIEDVKYSIRYFRELEARSEGGKVRLQVRLYRYAPMLHLVWTPDVCFVQQYYFCRSHSSAIKVPIFKCESRSEEEPKTFSAIDDLEFHFDWLWKYASIPASEYEDNAVHGVDNAIREANIQNIYYDTEKSRERILHLIEQAKEILFIKGVSLHSYLRHGPLFSAIIDACKRGVSVRLLLIDPNSEQARYRSFREYRIMHKKATLEEFTEDIQRGERLCSDTQTSIKFIKKQTTLHDLRNLDARLYFSAAEAFCLITDDAAVVEQYHYGTIAASETESTLGGDVPVVEYKRFTPHDEEVHLLTERDKVKDPYLLFKDHFLFVYEHCSKEIDYGPAGAPHPGPDRALTTP